MRVFVLSASVLSAAAAALGCSMEEQLSRQWFGRHISDVERFYGPPVAVEGNRYVFSEVREYVVGGPYGAGGVNDPSERVSARTVMVTFWVDRDGFVERIQYGP